MYKVEKYLEDAFGIKSRLVYPGKEDLAKLPVYLRNNNIKTLTINNQKIIIIKINYNAEYKIEKLKKQADIIKNTLGLPVAFIFEKIEAYNRKRLIQKNVAFIIPGKQIYLPFLFTHLGEIKSEQPKQREKLNPAAQCLLFYYLLGNKVTGLNFKAIAEKLNYGQMTITRAANTLNENGLCKIEGGKNKTLVFERDKREIWNKALPYLNSPAEKEIYLDEISNNNDFFITGINALSKYSNIAGDNKDTFAVFKYKLRNISNQEKRSAMNPIKENFLIQIWKYDPGNLTENKYVDPLSLYLTFKDIEDERIENELNNLIEKLWLTD